MKNKTLLLAIALLLSFSLSAQNFPNFGIVSKEELDLKECAFDKNAEAVVLLAEAESDHDEDYHLMTYHHVRIKILKEKAFNLANVTLRYWRKDDFEFLDMLEAVTINTGASGNAVSEKLPKSAFYKKAIDEHYGSVIFTFPSIRVGSIIEYTYRSFMKNYNGLDDWYFQQQIPVVKSKYTLTVLPSSEFTYHVNKRDDIPAIVKVQKDAGKVYFEMNNIPGLSTEPYMDAREDYLQKVMFQQSGYISWGGSKVNVMTSWDGVIKDFLMTKEFEGQVNKNIPGTGAFTDDIKKLTSDEDKMKAVYKYVRSNMTWNGYNSKYAGDGVKEAWEKKKGTNGEINLILINLLKEVGLETYPALVSERWHGKVNTDFPFVDQFNTVFACVDIKGKKYYLDATDHFTPAHMIPIDILNTTALIVKKKNGGLVTISNDSLLYNDFINLQMEVNENGTLSGEGDIENSGYSRINTVSAYKDEGQQTYIDNYLKKEGCMIKDFELVNKDNDSLPAEQKFKFNITLNSTGNYLLIPLNLFSGFEKNPFVTADRFSNVNFGYKRTIGAYASIKLPANYDVDALPKPVKMTTPDNDIVFTRSVVLDKESNILTCTYDIDFKKSLYTVDEYPILYEVYKKLFEFLNEPVVLKKK
jgi:hypothetical protein